jgi:hypothetical protein
MGDESSKAPLTRRVPGATRAGPSSSSRPELPAELLQRMQAVVNAAHAQAKQEDESPRKQSPPADQRVSPPGRGHAAGGGPKPSNGVRPKLTGPFRGRLSDEDADVATDELPRLTASGAVAIPGLDGAKTRSGHAAPPDQAAKPGRGDHAAKRDRRAERRERAAQAERARADQAEHARAAQEQAERERIREVELANRAAQVLRQRDRAAREQAEQEAAARSERERAERAERERAAQAEREQAERERTAREHAAREQAERDQAAREQAKREGAAREQAERDRAAREREHAAHERAVQAEREHAARKAEQERERAAQAEQERAEQEREQARRERAERESAAPGKRAAPAQADADNTTQLIITASTNGATTTNGAPKPDSAIKQDGAVGPDDTPKSNGTAKTVDHRSAATRAEVLEHPRRAARQAPTRRRGRTIALVAAAVVVVAAGPIAVMLSRHTAAPPDGSGSGLRNEAAAWISQQVSSNDVVSCDQAMCQTLEAYGVGTGNLFVMNRGQQHEVLTSQIIVATPSIRRMFGSSLDSVYAPTVIGSFGSGKARIDVRVVASRGAKAYQSQFQTDLLQRKTFGGSLATYSRLVLSPAAKTQMVTGQVDSRTLIMFTLLLGSKGTVNVLGFTDSGPHASPGVPLRSVYLAETGAIANARSTIALLHVQNYPNRPARAEAVRYDGKRALYIQFAAPPVLGLITQ